MPGKKHSVSVLKRARQSERRRIRNRARKLALKRKLKSFRSAKARNEAIELLPKVQSVVDKSARKGIIHRNTAARIKSQLARAAARLK